MYKWGANNLEQPNCCYCSVTQLCLILCDPTDCSMTGFLTFTISQILLKITSIEVVMPSTISSSVVSFSWCCLQSFPESRSFLMSWLFTSGGQSIGALTLASVLPMNIQDWFPLGMTGLISLLYTWDSQESSPAPPFKSIGSSALSLFMDLRG